MVKTIDNTEKVCYNNYRKKERGSKNDKERNQREDRQIRGFKVLPQHERPLDYRGLQNNKPIP